METMRLSVIIVVAVCVWSTSAYRLKVNHVLDYDLYKLDYNFTLGQANYAVYQPKKNVPHSGCYKHMALGINFTVSDYTMPYQQYNIERGHLAPDAGIGNKSCIMNNIAPMDSTFNQGVWSKSELFLRNNYTNYWIASGCKYNWDKFIITNGKKLYKIAGCYYVVFTSDPMVEDTEIIANGYIAINSIKTSDLPWWIVENSAPNIPNSDEFDITSILWLIVLGICITLMILFTIFIVALPYPSIEYVNPI
jgi:hypothetical protein